MKKTFDKMDFRVTRFGLSLKWIMCDYLNKWYDKNLSMCDDLLGLSKDGTVMDPGLVRYCLNEWWALRVVLQFLQELMMMDDRVCRETILKIDANVTELETILKDCEVDV